MSDFTPAFVFAMQHEVSPAFSIELASQYKDKGFAEFNTGEIVNWGITANTLKSLHLIPDNLTHQEIVQFMHNMQIGTIEEVYTKNYWNFFQYVAYEKGQSVSYPAPSRMAHQLIANKFFDMCVHMGPSGGAMVFHNALVDFDETVRSIMRWTNKYVDLSNGIDPRTLMAHVCIRYWDYLAGTIQKNPKNQQFHDAWLARAKWPFVTLPKIGAVDGPLIAGVSF